RVDCALDRFCTHPGLHSFPTRRSSDLLEQLRCGEKCACVLQEPLDLTQSGLSYHMKILCDSGIVTSRQEGKWTHYRLSASGRERSEEHTSELQSRFDLVCRLLLAKNNL